MTLELNEKKEIECPNCKGKIDVEVKRKKPQVIIEEQEQNTIKTQIQPSPGISTHEEPKIDPHEEIAKNLPLGVNFGMCTNGNCENPIIKNPKGMTTKFKACPNCHDNTNRKSAKVCKTCGKKPDEEDDWEDSEVEIEAQDGN